MTDTPPHLREPALTARAVMRGCGMAALATAQREADGWPYPSLVQVAFDTDGAPLLLISALADHTRNLLQDARAGLLFDGTAGLAEPLTGARLSVLGRLARTDDPRLRRRFLARHPSAGQYASFGDFALWRMAVERAHLVAGFGRIHWIPADHLLLPADMAAPVADREEDVVGHMNADHADAIALYATVLLGREPGEWRMTGIDPDGCDLRSGTVSVRLPLQKPAGSAEGLRVELVRLVKEARRRQDPDAAATG